MDLQPVKKENQCPQGDISSYLDGELAPQSELALEKHLGTCKICLDELNIQKKMLSALDFAFNDKNDEAEIELPKNFAKVIAAAAENNVSGLRRPEERFRALFLCAGLFLLVLIGVGAELGRILTIFTDFAGQTLALAGIAFHLVYDLAVGLGVICRALSQQFVVSSMFSILLLICSFIFSLILLSRLFVRYHRS